MALMQRTFVLMQRAVALMQRTLWRANAARFALMRNRSFPARDAIIRTKSAAFCMNEALR